VLKIINLFIYKIGRGGGDRGSNKEYSVKETFENYQNASRHMNNKKGDYFYRYPRQSIESDSGYVNCPCVIYILKHADFFVTCNFFEIIFI